MKKKIWFSLYDFSFDYKGDETPFIEEDFQWAKEFQKSHDIITTELQSYLSERSAEAYFNKSMVNKGNPWKTVSLKWWGIEFYKRQKYFPKTTAFLKKYPELLSLSFNLLESGGKIVPHCGDTNAIYRCHYGIKVPGKLPEIGFVVHDQKRSWKEGEWLIFMDAYKHEAFNLTKSDRIIMVVDYLRPEFSKKRSKIISVVLTSLFLQKRAEKFPFLKSFSQRTVRIISFFLRPIAGLSVKFCNLFKVY